MFQPMGLQISLHAADLFRFYLAIKNNRNAWICNGGVGMRILHPLGLSGKEQRPFTDEEIRMTMERYRYFEKWLKGE